MHPIYNSVTARLLGWQGLDLKAKKELMVTLRTDGEKILKRLNGFLSCCWRVIVALLKLLDMTDGLPLHQLVIQPGHLYSHTDVKILVQLQDAFVDIFHSRGIICEALMFFCNEKATALDEKQYGEVVLPSQLNMLFRPHRKTELFCPISVILSQIAVTSSCLSWLQCSCWRRLSYLWSSGAKRFLSRIFRLSFA